MRGSRRRPRRASEGTIREDARGEIRDAAPRDAASSETPRDAAPRDAASSETPRDAALDAAAAASLRGGASRVLGRGSAR